MVVPRGRRGDPSRLFLRSQGATRLVMRQRDPRAFSDPGPDGYPSTPLPPGTPPCPSMLGRWKRHCVEAFKRPRSAGIRVPSVGLGVQPAWRGCHTPGQKIPCRACPGHLWDPKRALNRRLVGSGSRRASQPKHRSRNPHQVRHSLGSKSEKWRAERLLLSHPVKGNPGGGLRPGCSKPSMDPRSVMSCPLLAHPRLLRCRSSPATTGFVGARHRELPNPR